MSTHFDAPLPLLSPELEKQLANTYRRTQDPRAEDRLVRSQLRLVAKLAHEYARRRQDDVEDLIQEGSLGLIQAVRRFDPSRGVRLSTYAAWWIRAYQLRWLVRNHRQVRVGTTAAQRRIFFNARGARRKLSAAGVGDSVAALARQMGVREGELEETLRRIDQREVSLDQPVREGEDATRLDQLADERHRPDERAEAKEIERLVVREAARFRASLHGRDRTLFDARWMRDTQPTLTALARRFGVSRERARQLEARLLRGLRRRLPSELTEAA